MEDYKPMSFRRLMELKQIDTNHFRSVSPAWSPATYNVNNKRAFGGHVYAQAAWAASQTIDTGLFIHNVTGHFLLGGNTSIPFEYHIKRVRDGGIYSLRTVEVYQHSNEATTAASGQVPCFISTISFKREERKDKTIDYGHQNALPDHLHTKYDIVLKGKQIKDHPLAPSGDALWWNNNNDKAKSLDQHARSFPGCEIRKVDMTLYNGVAEKGGGSNGVGVSSWRQLTFYRMIMDSTPHEDEKNLNLHACAHMYASDRNSLFLVLRALGYEKANAHMGSLAHTVIFHGRPGDFRMVDDDETSQQSKWFVQEAWTSNSGGGGDNRICHNSRLWDYNNNNNNQEGRKIFATTMQDGMMRLHIGRDRANKL